MEIEYEKGKSLIDFINNERLKKKVQIKKSFNYFNICCIKSIDELYKRLSKLSECQLEIIMGVNMFYHIFFVILSYTNNLTFTMFLAERGILLYTEFILMSKDTEIIKDLCYFPSITDAILFAYKKTIGPITIISKNNSNINLLITISSIMKVIYIEYYKYKTKIDSEDILKIEIALSEKIFKYVEKNNSSSTIKKILSYVDSNNYYYGLKSIKLMIEESDEILDISKEYTIDDL
tara:strand:+ start:6623 stop:7327 length:705 start_codon:yes stop_codon:yes gene_type:complete